MNIVRLRRHFREFRHSHFIHILWLMLKIEIWSWCLVNLVRFFGLNQITPLPGVAPGISTQRVAVLLLHHKSCAKTAPKNLFFFNQFFFFFSRFSWLTATTFTQIKHEILWTTVETILTTLKTEDTLKHLVIKTILTLGQNYFREIKHYLNYTWTYFEH